MNGFNRFAQRRSEMNNDSFTHFGKKGEKPPCFKASSAFSAKLLKRLF